MPEGSAGPPDYVHRIVDDELDELFAGLPAIALEGPRGVGKTRTASRRVMSTYLLDGERARELLNADLDRVSETTPVLIDEWQLLPQVWDAVRRAVDDDPSPGRFLLTGSAIPTALPVHSGAGRIVTLRMRPMGLSERGLVSPTVSLADLATGARARVTGHSELSLADYTEEIVRSGFPAIRGLNSRLRRQALDSYLDRILERDFLELGQRVRRPATLRAWLAAYAAATSTPTRFERIRDAATPGSADPPAQSTTAGYREVLTRLWLLDPVPGWLPTRNPFGRLRSAPKHHLADPALAACSSTRIRGVCCPAPLTVGRSRETARCWVPCSNPWSPSPYESSRKQRRWGSTTCARGKDVTKLT